MFSVLEIVATRYILQRLFDTKFYPSESLGPIAKYIISNIKISNENVPYPTILFNSVCFLIFTDVNLKFT